MCRTFPRKHLLSFLLLGTAVFGQAPRPAGLPTGLEGKVVNDYLVLPAHVQHVRVLSNETWAVATKADPENRRGRVEAKSDDGPAIRWIPADELAAATGVEPVAVLIDQSGAGWFRTIDTADRHAWIVSDGSAVHQVLADPSPSSNPTSNPNENPAESAAAIARRHALAGGPPRFRGVPWETRNGDLWMLSSTGIHRWQGAQTNTNAPSAKRLDHYPLRLGTNEPAPGTGDDAAALMAEESYWSAKYAIREGVGGQVLISRGCRDGSYDPSDDISEQTTAKQPRSPVWLYTPGWNGLARSSMPGMATDEQIFPEPGGFWLRSGPDSAQLQMWRENTVRPPPELARLVTELGARTYREREQASQKLHAEFGTWKEQLQAIHDAATDPEVRQRLAAIIAGLTTGGASGSADDEDSNLRQFPPSRRVVVPRSLDPEHTYLALQTRPPAADDPRPGRWALFAFGLDGSVEQIAADLPGHWAPSPALDSEQVSAFDLARVDQRTFAWRDGLGGLCILRDGKRVRLAPPPGGPARFPLPQCRILSVWPGGLIVRLHRQVLVISAETIRTAPVDDIPPPVELSKELRAHTARFVREYKDYYNSDLDAEDLLKLADRVLAQAPTYPRGLYAQGEFRSSIAGEGGSRIALRAASQAMGLARDSGGDRVLERASIWGDLGFRIEAVRDMNHIIEVEDRYHGETLASQFLVRGNHFLEAQQWQACLRDFRRSIAINPDNQVSRNNIAWVLAGAADERFRDGKEAVRLATIVCEAEDYEASYSVDTLAAAYAELGDFEKAIEMQEKAIGLIDPEEDKERWGEFQAHLKLFKMKKPVRLPEPSTPVEPEQDAEDQRGL